MLRVLLLVAFVFGGASVFVNGVTVDELAAQVRAQKTQLDSQASELQAQKTEIQALRRTMDTDRAEISARQSAAANISEGVYFTAFLSDYLQDYEGILRPFNPVTNVGGGFEASSGMFIAPVPGVYLFIASAGTFGTNHHINMRLVKGAYEISSAWVGSGGSDAMGTVQATVHMTTGERVWLQSMQTNTYYYHHSTGFTGVLLRADS